MVPARKRRDTSPAIQSRCSRRAYDIDLLQGVSACLGRATVTTTNYSATARRSRLLCRGSALAAAILDSGDAGCENF